MRSGGGPTAIAGGTSAGVAAAPRSRVRLPGSAGRDPAARGVPRGRHGYPLDEVSAYQRVRLLDAFVAEVAQRGFPGTRVAHVCAAAGTSTKAFYAAFGTKDAGLLCAFDVGARVLSHHGTIAFRRHGGPHPERVEVAMDTVLGILADNPPFTRVALLEVPRLGPAGAERFDVAVERFGAGVGLAPPGPRPPGLPVGLLSVFVGGAVRLLAGYVAAGRTDQLRDAGPHLSRWAAVCATPAAGAGAEPAS